MCYVLSKKIHATETAEKPLCYFHDRETARDVLDRLEEYDTETNYVVYKYPTYLAESQKIPYCQDILPELGITFS